MQAHGTVLMWHYFCCEWHFYLIWCSGANSLPDGYLEWNSKTRSQISAAVMPSRLLTAVVGLNENERPGVDEPVTTHMQRTPCVLERRLFILVGVLLGLVTVDNLLSCKTSNMYALCTCPLQTNATSMSAAVCHDASSSSCCCCKVGSLLLHWRAVHAHHWPSPPRYLWSRHRWPPRPVVYCQSSSVMRLA